MLIDEHLTVITRSKNPVDTKDSIGVYERAKVAIKPVASLEKLLGG